MNIEQLKTNEQIAQLNQYHDPLTVQYMGCEHGTVVQWYQSVPEDARDNFLILAAKENGRIIGYAAATLCLVPPLMNEVWVMHRAVNNQHVEDALFKHLVEWAKKQGAKNIVSSTYDERLVTYYTRRYNMRMRAFELELPLGEGN